MVRILLSYTTLTLPLFDQLLGNYSANNHDIRQEIEKGTSKIEKS